MSTWGEKHIDPEGHESVPPPAPARRQRIETPPCSLRIRRRARAPPVETGREETNTDPSRRPRQQVRGGAALHQRDIGERVDSHHRAKVSPTLYALAGLAARAGNLLRTSASASVSRPKSGQRRATNRSRQRCCPHQRQRCPRPRAYAAGGMDRLGHGSGRTSRSAWLRLLTTTLSPARRSQPWQGRPQPCHPRPSPPPPADAIGIAHPANIAPTLAPRLPPLEQRPALALAGQARMDETRTARRHRQALGAGPSASHLVRCRRPRGRGQPVVDRQPRLASDPVVSPAAARGSRKRCPAAQLPLPIENAARLRALGAPASLAVASVNRPPAEQLLRPQSVLPQRSSGSICCRRRRRARSVGQLSDQAGEPEGAPNPGSQQRRRRPDRDRHRRAPPGLGLFVGDHAATGNTISSAGSSPRSTVSTGSARTTNAWRSLPPRSPWIRTRCWQQISLHRLGAASASSGNTTTVPMPQPRRLRPGARPA